MENDKKRNTIIAIALAGALVVILIIAWVVSQVSSKGETGGLKTDDGATVTTDVSKITELGFSQKLYSDFAENFFDAMVVINPTCNKQAKGKNFKNDGNTYTFDIVRCNETYNAEVTESGSNYSFTISKNGEMLTTYNSTNKGRNYLSAESISKYLPMNSQTNEGLKYTIKQTNKANLTELEISVDSCGSQEKKNKAVASAKEVLEYTGFNPEDFTYNTPNYCDSEM